MLPILAKALDYSIFAFMQTRLRWDFNLDPQAMMEKLDKIANFSLTDFYNTQIPKAELNFELKPFSSCGSSLNLKEYDFTYQSPFASKYPVNNMVRGRLYKNIKSNSSSPGVLIILPGWMTFSYKLYAGFARQLSRTGFDTKILQLPYHMQRAPKGSFSGEYMISKDLAGTVQAIQQALLDIGVLIRLCKSAHKKLVGILGISLGGWIAALLSCLEPQLDFCILLSGAVRPDYILKNAFIASGLRKSILSLGLKLDLIDSSIAEFIPRNFKPLLKPKNFLLQHGWYDTASDLQHLSELAHNWKIANLKTYPEGHISILLSGRTFKDLKAFLEQQKSN